MIELNSTIVKDFLEFKIDLEELVRQGLQLNNPRKEFSKEDVDKNVDLFISSAIKKAEAATEPMDRRNTSVDFINYYDESVEFNVFHMRSIIYYMGTPFINMYEFYETYWIPLTYILPHYLDIPDRNPLINYLNIFIPKNINEVFWMMYYEIDSYVKDVIMKIYDDSEMIFEVLDISELKNIVDNFFNNMDAKSLQDMQFTERQMHFFIKHMYEENELDNASDDVKNFFKMLVDRQIKNHDPDALDIKGFGCYGGDGVYECDYEEAAKCLSKLIHYPNHEYASIPLGNIYYYDYINNGSPDYEQAYFYYQIGAKAGYHAAMYMLSDMMINGQYVEKDVELGMSVLVNLYDELLHRFEKGEFLTDFPEVAYRMGNASMISSSKIPFTSPYLSASYYLQARTAYAIRSVLVSSNEDKQLGYDIVDALNNLNTFIKPKKTTFRDSIPNVLHNFITSIKDSTYTLKFKSQANNITKLTVTRNPQKDSNTSYKSFVSVPELNNCKFTNEIRIYADSADNTSLPEKKVIFDNIEENFDKDNKIYETFMYKGKIVAKIHAKSWIYKVSDAYDVL